MSEQKMEHMSDGIFCVRVREDYERDRQDYFPHISSNCTSIAKSFDKGRVYPVPAVRHTTLIADDLKNVETSRFLVPTENGNFISVQSEIFRFARITAEHN